MSIDIKPAFNSLIFNIVNNIIEKNKENPFFLYLPLNSPHLPVAPSAPFRGKSGAGDYGDFVMETDDCVDAVLQTLDEIDQAKNTLVVFTSDNGGLWHQWQPVDKDDVKYYRPTPRAKYTYQFGHQSNAHLRGTKADIWEGGHRVPLAERGGGRSRLCELGCAARLLTLGLPIPICEL